MNIPILLVPKLCLGTHLSSKLCFAAPRQLSCEDIAIPKLCLGTRSQEN
jgi:hypothetical protein